MTTRYKTRAFVFKKNDRNESDRVFSVFTDDFGRLDIFAKAIRKAASKLRSGIDIFFMSDIEFIQGKNKKTLTDAAVIKRFDNIFNNIDRFRAANGIGKVLDNFINGEEKDKKIFSLLEDVFYKLNDQNLDDKKSLLVYYYFLWNALMALGYCPEVERCGVCQKKLDPSIIYFSNKVGGIICNKCNSHDAAAKEINSDVVKVLRIIFKKEWDILSKLKINMQSQELLKNVSDNYYLYTISGHSFKNNYSVT
jgi:DNA repair protein RecO (recombination protein O)